MVCLICTLIQVGGYDLISLSRVVPHQFMALDEKGKSIGSACFASGWYDYLNERVTSFIKVSGPFLSTLKSHL